MVIAKEPRQYKLQIEKSIVEQIMRFKYLGVETTTHRNLNEQFNIIAEHTSITNIIMFKEYHISKQIYEKGSKS